MERTQQGLGSRVELLSIAAAAAQSCPGNLAEARPNTLERFKSQRVQKTASMEWRAQYGRKSHLTTITVVTSQAKIEGDKPARASRVAVYCPTPMRLAGVRR